MFCVVTYLNHNFYGSLTRYSMVLCGNYLLMWRDTKIIFSTTLVTFRYIVYATSIDNSHISTLLILEFKYVTKSNIYNWKTVLKYIIFKYKKSKHIEFQQQLSLFSIFLGEICNLEHSSKN